MGGIIGGGGGSSASSQSNNEVDVTVNPNIAVVNTVDLEPVQNLVNALTDAQATTAFIQVAGEQARFQAETKQRADFFEKLKSATLLVGLGLGAVYLARR